ncbi:TraR/DksA C4-type zinc finger protein [Virgibacillus soli]|uniref:TraR/DksA C4-type zinc finger protein n=1 Tax=Paracerasibacillus soli TaxID=480284 RepID=A0ABU5CYC8_9BACI|nr:TraR/DksA C4-type zinc finger protein [Virgibacillus soli]MDY0410423.1 TraR/DksA C4-type zinc finger protein [Virgibacillus soli]
MVTGQQAYELKQGLLQRQAELIKQVQDHFGLKFEMIKESMSELSNYDNHPGDHGTELYERGKDLALNEHAEKELQEINEALHALDEGTYGFCSVCGKDIPFERLQAVPTTDRCIDHANNDTFEHNRPIEEQVFSPNINPDEVTAETQVGYDAEDAWQEVSRYGSSDSPSDFFGDEEHYNGTFANSDEEIGSVENIESYLAADQHGKYTGVMPNHNKYENEYKDDDMK